MSAVQKRDRGRMLTEAGLEKLRHGIRAWEQQQGRKATHERLAEIAHLDAGVIANIRSQKKRADLGSIDRLFTILTLTLEEQDTCFEVPATAITDPNFVGRDDAIADLDAIASQAVQVIVIQAKGGIGKTTLARHYLAQRFATCIEFPIAKEIKDIADIGGLLEEKLRQLGEEPGQDFWVSLDRFKRKLQTERIGILIDNLETALDATGKLIEPHRRYVELLRMLADPTVQSLTLITSREWLYESSITVQPYRLKELNVSAWEQFFQVRGLPIVAPAPPETSPPASLQRRRGDVTALLVPG